MKKYVILVLVTLISIVTYSQSSKQEAFNIIVKLLTKTDVGETQESTHNRIELLDYDFGSLKIKYHLYNYYYVPGSGVNIRKELIILDLRKTSLEWNGEPGVFKKLAPLWSRNCTRLYLDEMISTEQIIESSNGTDKRGWFHNELYFCFNEETLDQERFESAVRFLID
jgi:hypothetical protein